MKFIVMPDGLAVALVHSAFLNSDLRWGRPIYEDDDAIGRRGMFSHDFTASELDQPPMSTNPNVHVLDHVPEDWRYEIFD